MAALGVDKVRVLYGREPPVVEIYVEDKDLHKGEPPDGLSLRLEQLDSMVHYLLGPEYRVVVAWDDDVIWDKLGSGECPTNHKPIGQDT